MIYKLTTQAQVDAIPDPKHVWYDVPNKLFIVCTGDDMEKPDPEEKAKADLRALEPSVFGSNGDLQARIARLERVVSYYLRRL